MGYTELWDRKVEAGWNKDGQLLIETSSERGEIIETYQLNAGVQTLTLIIDINDRESGGKYRRVFERKQTS